MSKKNKRPDFAGLKIILIAGAIGAAIATVVLGFLAFSASYKKEKLQDPEEEPEEESEEEPEEESEPEK